MKKVFAFFTICFFVYFASSGGHTPYNYFTRLADAFLHGRLYLINPPSWLSELLELKPDKYFVVYPPMPAIISMPFVFFLGKNFPQEYVSQLAGAAVGAISFLTSFYITKNKTKALWVGILIGFGSIVWYMSATGSVWYFGQICAALFLSLAIYESITKKRPFIIGLLIGASYLSRIPTIIAAPFLYVLINEDIFSKERSFSAFLQTFFTKRAIFSGIYMIIGFLPFLIFDSWYNMVRFGVPWDNAYFLLPKALNETNSPWFRYGVMNVRYITSNISTALFSFPKILSTFPFIEPSWYGLSIWITTPAFVFSLKSIRQNWVTKIAWVSIVFIFLFEAMHGGTGWAQFGYRFAVDFYPILTLLTAVSIKDTRLRWYHWALLVICILVNLWGVIWINKFGWVGY